MEHTLVGFGTSLYFSLLAVRFLDILRHGDVRRGPHLLFDERFQRVYERVNVSFVEQMLRRGPHPGLGRIVREPPVRRRRQPLPDAKKREKVTGSFSPSPQKPTRFARLEAHCWKTGVKFEVEAGWK